MDGGVLLGVPGVVDGDDHVDGAATEVTSVLHHVSGGFTNDQGADVWEAENLVE